MKKLNIALFCLSLAVLASCGGTSLSSDDQTSNSTIDSNTQESTDNSSSSSESSGNTSDSSISSDDSSDSSSSTRPDFVVPKYDISIAPKNIDELQTYLTDKSLEAESLYTNSFIQEKKDDYGDSYKTNGYVFENPAVVKETTKLSGTNNAKKEVEYIGLYNLSDRFYKIKFQTDYSSSAQALKIVEKDSYNNKTEILKSDAIAQSTSAGVVKHIIDDYISGSKLTYNKEELIYTNKLSSDGKYYIMQMQAIDNYSPVVKELTLELDGNNNIKSSYFESRKYESDNWNSEDNLPIDPNIYSLQTYDYIDVSSGYRFDESLNTLIDPTQFFMSDFEYRLYYSKGYGNNIYSNVIEAGYGIDVQLVDFEPYAAIDDINIVSSSNLDVINYVDGEWIGLSKGHSTLTIESSNGVIKQQEVEIIDPLPTSINVSVEGNKVYINEATPLNITFEPSVINISEAIVEKLNTSTAEANISFDEETNSYSILATTLGVLDIRVSSKQVPSISQEISLEVKERPTMDMFKEKLIGTYKGSYYNNNSYQTDICKIEFVDETSGFLYKPYGEYASEGEKIAIEYTLEDFSINLVGEYEIADSIKLNSLSFDVETEVVTMNCDVNSGWYGWENINIEMTKISY